jgi:LPS sulfotransferase NodH
MSYPFPLHRNEPLRPFFIVGSGRSGNTLLRRLLQASPEVHIPPETYVLGKSIRAYRRYRWLMSWPNLVNFTLSHFEFYHEFPAFEISLRPLAESLKALPANSRSMAKILDAFYRFHGQQVGKTFSVWGDKTPNNSYSLDRIFSVFPKAQFIHILRDGADVIPSLLKANIRPDLESAARRWQTSVAAVQKFIRKHPSNCIEIRYENLARNPEATMKPIFDFLKLPFDASLIESQAPASTMRDLSKYAHLSNVMNPVSTESIGKGRNQLSQEQKQILQSMIGADLERLGYAPLS